MTDARITVTAEDKTAAAFRAVTGGLDKIGLSASGLAAGLSAVAAGFSVGALGQFVKSTVDAVDALNDVADATGSSIENISALEDLAKRTGASLDDVAGILVKFNGALKEADPKKGAGAVLKALNLDIEQLKRLDPAEALRQVAVAFGGFEDSGSKARAMQELFGKSTREAAAYMKDLAAVKQLDAKVTGEQAEQAEKFNKQLFELSANVDAAARSILGSIVPALNQTFSFFGRIGKGEEIEFLEVKIRKLKEQLDDLSERKGSSGVDRQIADITSQIEAAQKNLKAVIGPSERDLLRGMDRNIGAELPKLPDIVGGNPSGGRSSKGGVPKASEAERYLKDLNKQLQATEELTTYEKLLADIRVGSLGKVSPQLQAQLTETAKLIDADKELSQATKEFADLEVAAAKKRSALRDEAQGFYDSTRTPIERLNIELARQDELLRKLGPAYKDTYMRANEAAQDRYEKETATSDGLNELTRSAIQASKNIQNALGTTLKDVLKGDFDSIGDAFGDLLADMAAQAAAAQIMDAFFGKANSQGKRSGSGILGDLGGFLDFLPSFDGGGYTGGGARSGGIDGKGGFLSVLHPGETVTDHTRGGRGGGSGQTIVVNQSFTVGDVASISMVRQAVAGSEARIAAQFARSQKYGGAAS